MVQTVWLLRVLVAGPEPVTAEWLAGHVTPALAPYLELSPRFTRVVQPITSVRPPTDADPVNVAMTGGLFNGTTVQDPTVRVFTGFTWALTEKQPVVRGSGRESQAAANDARRIGTAVGNRLASTFGEASGSGDWQPSSTGFYSSQIVVERGAPLGPPLGEIPVPAEGTRWGWWLAAGALGLLAGWAIFGGRGRGGARRLTRR